ncbi:MAG TPA: dTMP kinase [Stellaceae bacterium]
MGKEALSGRFITLEGGEGAGKSTQAKLLVAALTSAGIGVIATREPGGAPAAELIRELLLKGEPGRWDGISEALLMVAARRAHLNETILPALTRGDWVVCDRFADSTTAYQGHGAGVPVAALDALHRLIAGDLKPDLTLLLDLPVEAGLARAHARRGDETRFEQKDSHFHKRVRRGFLAVAKAEPTRCIVIDASRPVADIHRAVLSVMAAKLGIAFP